MADKKITKNIKVKIEAGKATPAPPLGPALGQAGVNIGDFVNKFNTDTRDKSGLLGVKIRVFEDRTYEYDIKTPITTTLIKAKAGVTKGNSKSGNAGKMTTAQLKEIATEKMIDLNAHSVEQAMKVIAGSARSMGIKIVD
jgi:large subunit ribosomal protein L11